MEWISEIPLALWIAGILALYMAWAIGANDVANAMGTSVGSGALTVGGAIIVAAVLEFAGAFLERKTLILRLQYIFMVSFLAWNKSSKTYLAMKI